jgi:hypothetical protein
MLEKANSWPPPPKPPEPFAVPKLISKLHRQQAERKTNDQTGCNGVVTIPKENCGAAHPRKEYARDEAATKADDFFGAIRWLQRFASLTLRLTGSRVYRRSGGAVCSNHFSKFFDHESNPQILLSNSPGQPGNSGKKERHEYSD